MRSEETPVTRGREQTNRPEPTPIPIQKPDYVNTTKGKKNDSTRKESNKGKKGGGRKKKKIDSPSLTPIRHEQNIPELVLWSRGC